MKRLPQTSHKSIASNTVFQKIQMASLGESVALLEPDCLQVTIHRLVEKRIGFGKFCADLQALVVLFKVLDAPFQLQLVVEFR